MIVVRKAENLIKNKVKPGKVVVLHGARRVGKTFLIKEYLKTVEEKYIFWNGEDFAVHELLSRRSVQNYKNLLGSTKLLVIDEAHKIPDIGHILKLIVDSFEDLKVIVTGSSAFDIANITGEPLTGRKYEIMLYPVSESEFSQFEKPEERHDNLLHRLVYGNLPELISISDPDDKAAYLRDLVNSYLLKDILAFKNIKNSLKLLNLLKLIAYQIGSEVSIEELGRQTAMSKNTVEKYLDLLSKVFVLYRLNGFSRNLRKEVVKNSKWYFYDNGVRNAIVTNFNPISLREDKGLLWENYMMSERIKYHSYSETVCNRYFWRTYDKQEIDLVEEREGKLFAYEFKWKNDRIKIPAAWRKAYPNSSFETITIENISDWLS
ncbi:MAG: ATPase [Ignavibacteria bacterium RIFOXYA2_FULL_35_9]|nr:MAG: ATPase [Ignavibacteria bacterium RIFOXYA2_FULL_35_9]